MIRFLKIVLYTAGAAAVTGALISTVWDHVLSTQFAVCLIAAFTAFRTWMGAYYDEMLKESGKTGHMKIVILAQGLGFLVGVLSSYVWQGVILASALNGAATAIAMLLGSVVWLFRQASKERNDTTN